MLSEERSIYTIIGGDKTIQAIVDIFYAKIEADDSLREMFPDDLEEGKHWQYLFLRQFFGGPTDYSTQRGHPRLRMRHQPFRIDQQARDAWLSHMLAAIDEVGIEEPAKMFMRNYFERASTHLINTHVSTDKSDE